jgi:hypothetical protein
MDFFNLPMRRLRALHALRMSSFGSKETKSETRSYSERSMAAGRIEVGSKEKRLIG